MANSPMRGRPASHPIIRWCTKTTSRRFLATYDKAVAALYPNGPASDDYSIINDRHYARLNELLEDARTKGARVVEPGPKPSGADSRPHTLAPTIVLGATDEMRIMQEEIFGPLLPILT